MVSAEVDPRVIPGLVAASQEAARSAPEAGDAAPLLADTGVPADWDAPVPGTGRRGVRRCRRLVEPGLPRHRSAVRLCAPQCFDDVPGVVDGTAPALHPAHRGGGDQRQTRRRQRLGGYRHARFRRCANGSAARGAVDAAGLGAAQRRAARRTLRDDHAAVDGGRHDDLPGLVDGRPRRAGGPHRLLGARRRDPGGGAAHRLAADAVLRSDGAGPGVYTVRRGEQLLGDGRRCSTTAWRSARWTGSATG